MASQSDQRDARRRNEEAVEEIKGEARRACSCSQAKEGARQEQSRVVRKERTKNKKATLPLTAIITAATLSLFRLLPAVGEDAQERRNSTSEEGRLKRRDKNRYGERRGDSQRVVETARDTCFLLCNAHRAQGKSRETKKRPPDGKIQKLQQ